MRVYNGACVFHSPQIPYGSRTPRSTAGAPCVTGCARPACTPSWGAPPRQTSPAKSAYSPQDSWDREVGRCLSPSLCLSQSLSSSCGLPLFLHFLCLLPLSLSFSIVLFLSLSLSLLLLRSLSLFLQALSLSLSPLPPSLSQTLLSCSLALFLHSRFSSLSVPSSQLSLALAISGYLPPTACCY